MHTPSHMIISSDIIISTCILADRFSSFPSCANGILMVCMHCVGRKQAIPGRREQRTGQHQPQTDQTGAVAGEVKYFSRVSSRQSVPPPPLGGVLLYV